MFEVILLIWGFQKVKILKMIAFGIKVIVFIWKVRIRRLLYLKFLLQILEGDNKMYQKSNILTLFPGHRKLYNKNYNCLYTGKN